MSTPYSMDSSAMMSGAPPVVELKRSWTPRIALILLVLPLGLVFLVASGFGFLGVFKDGFTADRLLGPSLGVVLSLGLLLLFAWRMWAEFGRRAAVYDTGVELVTYRGTTTARWEEINEVWFFAQRVRMGGLLGMLIMWIVDKMRKDTPLDQRGVTMRLTIVCGPTKKIVLGSSDKGCFKAWQEVLSRVNPRLIADAVKRVKAGEHVPFGKKISLGQAGISFKGKPDVPWSKIKSVEIQNGALSIKIEDKWFGSGAMVSTIPNLFVLTAAISQLGGSTIEMKVQPGMNMAQSVYA